MHVRQIALSLGLIICLSACAPLLQQNGPEEFSAPDNMAARPHILLTNDDGIKSEGLTTLLVALETWADVTVSAPADNQSGVSQSIKAMSGKVVVKESQRPNSGMNYGVFGTPADAVIFGMRHANPDHPFDLVISGINRGQNAGIFVGNSGTVGAAKQAVTLGLPAIAVSQQFSRNGIYDFKVAAAFASEFAAEMWQKRSSAPRLININVPTKVSGALITKVGGVPFQFDGYERVEETQKGTVYRAQMSLADSGVAGADDLDSVALSKGFITITVLQTDATDAKGNKALKPWETIDHWQSGDPR